MSHLDEGQLAALLDNELEPGEKLAVEAHLASCAECRAVWDDTRSFAAEADRLVAAVELPPKPLAMPRSSAAVPRDSPLPSARRPVPWKALAWAASVMLAVGLGYSMRSVSRYGTDSARLPGSIDSGMFTARADKVVAPPPEAPAPPSVRAGQPARGAPAEAEKQSEPLASRLDKGSTGQSGNLARAAAPASAPSGAAPAATDRERASDALNARPADTPSAARGLAAPVGATFQEVDMAMAVRSLAGSIRLVDGLEPQRVLAGPGTLFAGGDPEQQTIRVVYLDPPGRELWLDQQRTGVALESRGAHPAAGLLPGDTVIVTPSGGGRSIRWIDQDGFRLTLTGFLSADSLRSLVPRVR
jgi:Putative zinc-finger